MIDSKALEAVARAIWNIRREDEDRCDMELEDMGRDHSVWSEARAALRALSATSPAADGWQDIESAPHFRDILVGRWTGEDWQATAYIILSDHWREDWDDEPTHWRYAPAPPPRPALSANGGK